MEKKSLGETLKQARLSLGVTQKKLADICGITQPHLSNIENNNYLPYPYTLRKLCSVLKLDLKWILVTYYELSKDNVDKFIKMELINYGLSQDGVVIHCQTDQTHLYKIDTEKSLGATLKQARMMKGLSQLDLAILIDSNKQDINNYEMGRRKPRQKKLKKLCDTLNLDIEDILKNFFNIPADNTFGSCIKQARMIKGLSQLDLAILIDSNQKDIKNYEMGRKKPKQKNLKKLSDVLNLNLKDILKDFYDIPSDDTLGSCIKQARMMQGWTQLDLSILVGTNATTIGAYEAGKITPNLQLLKKICDTLELNFEEMSECSKTRHLI